MAELKDFLQRAHRMSNYDQLRRKILKSINSYDAAVTQMKSHQFNDWEKARRLAAQVKDYTLAHLPDLLETFEKRITARGTKVLWAESAAQAREYFMKIIESCGARKVVKSKSMTTEEIQLNELLEDSGVEVWESDLGELIVQLSGEKPYHIVTPAMHKSKADIAKLFHEKLGVDETENAEDLTMVAREHLRKTYVTADIGVTGANFIIAEEGAVVITENEGNGRLTVSCPPVHVVFVGIEKVLPRLSDLALFLPLLATSGTGQQITCYNSIVRGPRQPGESDGPEEMYVILLDNGRSELYTKEKFRDVLRCIRCGACINLCPVFRTVGGHTYNTTYQGPIGSVITPHFLGMDIWHHLPFASSLCGACSDVCPVHIDIHRLLLENRWEAVQKMYDGRIWSVAMKLWAFVMRSRRRLQMFHQIARLSEKLLFLFLSKNRRARMPRLAPKTFAELWRENEKSR
ncbi:MAG: LutB/LldF family L-lactate oxidation iron-sulfur protein [bacterium]